MKHLALLISLAVALPSFAADDPSKVLPDKEKSKDGRLGKNKTLNDYFPFTPPASKESWNDRASRVHEQLLVANGLWPMPEKTPLKPVIHGKIERDGYTIEKVSFASMPGHYVTGNLYRPTAKVEGKRPAILNPHGHWPNGRFMEANDAEVKKQMETKDKKTGQPAEATIESARYPLQAKCVGLVRMGFVVFQYDMIGYADSTAITFKEAHREGFRDVEADHRLQSIMGMQTWNSIRSYDFLESLPDVDPKRIGVTGASGGGTQTFMFCALDSRPAAAFPAVMVSTAMQGGCFCENCSYLRVGTGNVEFAGLFAPRPQAMSAANDWTLEIETKGLPELKKLYKLLGKEELVDARCWPEFGHNYNQVSREYMYRWFNKHLLASDKEVKELPFNPVPVKQLSVYDAEHPRPKDELDSAALRQVMTKAAEKQLKALEPTDARSLETYRQTIRTALRVMVGDSLPAADQLAFRMPMKESKTPSGLTLHKAIVGRTGENDAMPMCGIIPDGFAGEIVIWVHPEGKKSMFGKDGEPVAAVKSLLEKKVAVLGIDVFQTGENASGQPMAVDGFAGYTYGYNRTLLGQRVHDILTAVAVMSGGPKKAKLHLVGWDKAGPWVVIAKALAGDRVARTAADLNQFRFENVKSNADEMMLPGAVKYGGMPAFISLCAPGDLYLHNHAGTSSGKLPKQVFKLAGAENKLFRDKDKAEPAKVVEWLLK